MGIAVRRSVAGLLAAIVCAVGVRSMHAQSVGPVTTATTLDAIVAQHIQAMGGTARIKAVRSLKQTGHVTIPGLDTPVTLTIYTRRPNMVRQEVGMPGGTLVTAYDGATAWQIDPRNVVTAATTLTGGAAASLRQQAELDTPLLDYKTRGYTLEFVNTETDGARRLHHLKLTDKQGKIQHCYLDAATGLAVKITGDSDAGSTEQQFADYRDVAGLKIPFKVTSLLGGTILAVIGFDSAQVDTPMDDALFKMPAKSATPTHHSAAPAVPLGAN